jgi:hypothetical protein
MTRFFVVCVVLGFGISTAAQDVAPAGRLLVRRYVEGETFAYLMKGKNNANSYDVTITATVKKNADGRFVDELAWSNGIVNGVPRQLSPAAQAIRVAVTLEGGVPFVLPNFTGARGLVGPVTDSLTFYSDLFVAMHGGTLNKAGDHLRVPIPMAPSWAGGLVIIGEDSFEFDITLTTVDTAHGTARLLVKHVPPAAPKIRIPAEWMREPVADTPNNWVQVEKTATGFDASIGKETFDVDLTVNLADGKILSATMDNPVTAVTRSCKDEALTQCGPSRPDPTFRHIEMTLLRK